MIDIENIYICHWKKLTERKSNLVAHLSEIGIKKYQWVEKYDKDSWNIEEIQKEYPLIFDNNPLGRKLKWSEISLTLKHSWIIKDSFEKGYDDVLVFEDDVILHPNFIEYFNLFKTQIPKDWDIVWIGSCCNLHAPCTEGKYFYKADGSRCTHTFMLSKSCVNKIVNEVSNINDGSDFYYNFLIKKYNLNNYWMEPVLSYQNTNYKTTIQNNILY